MMICVLLPSLLIADSRFDGVSNHYQSVGENRDVEKQIAGDYPSMSRENLDPAGAIQHAWDSDEGHQGVYVVHFNPEKTIKVRAREFMNTTIVLPGWETIKHVEIGDMSAFAYTQPDPNKIVLWPQKIVGIDTNITLMGGSGNVYPIYARVEGYNSKHISDLVVHLRVPFPKNRMNAIQGNMISDEEKNDIDYLGEVKFNPSELEFNYSMSGDKEIAPERVYSDKRHTWFDYGNKIIKEDNIPTIFVVVDGVDQPIDVFREGNKLVAQTTGKFTLKQQNKTVCVYRTKEL